MSNAEGEKPDFEPLDLPDDNVPEPDLGDLDLPGDEPAVADLGELVLPEGGLTEADLGESDLAGDEPPMAEPGKDEEAPAEEGEEEEQEEEKKEKLPRRLLKAVTDTDPYMVMLGVSLLAILIAVFCLLMELAAYDNDIKAEGARQPAMVWPPTVQSGPASTTAAAWPIDVKLTDKAEDAEPRSGSPWIT